MSNIVHVLYIPTKNNIIPVSVSIASLIQNNNETALCIHVLSHAFDGIEIRKYVNLPDNIDVKNYRYDPDISIGKMLNDIFSSQKIEQLLYISSQSVMLGPVDAMLNKVPEQSISHMQKFEEVDICVLTNTKLDDRIDDENEKSESITDITSIKKVGRTENIDLLIFDYPDVPWKNMNAPFSRVWYKYLDKTNIDKGIFYYQLCGSTSYSRVRLKKKIVRNAREIISLISEKLIKKNVLSLTDRIFAGFLESLSFVGGMISVPFLLLYYIILLRKKTISYTGSGKELVVSFTTILERSKGVHKQIVNVLCQTVSPNKIVLYLGKESEGKRISILLRFLRNYGFEIRYVEDIGPATKLIPALKDFPDDTIVTIDDDIKYPLDLIERLVDGNKKNPDTIVAARAHRVAFFKDGSIGNYTDWAGNVGNGEVSKFIFVTGVGGVLYPSNVFSEEIFNIEKMKRLTPRNDDIWYWAMSLLNRKNTYVLPGARPLRERKSLQGSGLFHYNTSLGGNDIQLARVFEEYNLSQILLEELENTENL